MVLAFLVGNTYFASESQAVPNCSQINSNNFCYRQNCNAYIVWQGDCSTGDREWRCVFYGGPGCNTLPLTNFSPCNCSGEGCDCLLEGTDITLADGTVKPIDAIRVGDLVLSYDTFSGEMISSAVVAVHKPYPVSQYFSINHKVKVTANHPMLSNGGWVGAGELSVGKSLTLPGGAQLPIFSIEKVQEDALVYNFQVASGTYVAGGDRCRSLEIDNNL